MARGNVANLTNAGKGRPTGAKNRVSRSMQDTLRHVWETMQSNSKTSLLTLAQANPQWFYELCRGMFPKDLFIEADLNLSCMSPEEIRAKVVELIKTTPEILRLVRSIKFDDAIEEEMAIYSVVK